MNTMAESESEAAITQENEPESEVRQETTPDRFTTIMKKRMKRQQSVSPRSKRPTTTPESTATPEPVTMYITRPDRI